MQACAPWILQFTTNGKCNSSSHGSKFWPSRNRLSYGRYRIDTRVKIGLYRSNERGFSGFVEERGFILRVIEGEIGT